MAVEKQNLALRTMVIVGIMLLIALIHIFRVGTYFSGKLFTLYYSYASDIIIPFGMYFLLCLNDSHRKLLQGWVRKSLVVFVISSATEIAQAFGIYMLGVTYDPVDIVMFGVGVLLAAFVDQVVLARALPFWCPVKETGS
jgi:hypothetical protein